MAFLVLKLSVNEVTVAFDHATGSEVDRNGRLVGSKPTLVRGRLVCVRASTSSALQPARDADVAASDRDVRPNPPSSVGEYAQLPVRIPALGLMTW